MLGTSDLFVVGLGFDLTGAVLLALGLLVSPEQLVLRDLTYWGSSGSIGWSIKDKVYGIFGVFWLVAGFLVQAAGYALTIGRSHTSSSGWVAVGLCAAGVVVAAGSAWGLSGPLIRREGIRAARVVPVQVDNKTVVSRTDPLPYGDRLEIIGRFLGYSQRTEDEPQADYVLRVWRLERFQPGDIDHQNDQ